MPIVRQASFASGELAPQLRGRTDSKIRAQGLKRLENFFVSRHGVLHSRAGLRKVGRVGHETIEGWRLIPFVYSDSQAYVLELGDLYLRVWRTGGTMVTPVDGAAADELVTPYTGPQLAQLKFAQVGDVMTLVHPSHAPRELTRVADTNWTLTSIEFERPWPNRTPNGVLPAAAADSGDMALLEPLPAATADEPAQRWKYLITQLFPVSSNRPLEYYESRPYTLIQSTSVVAYPGATVRTTIPDNIAIYQDLPQTIQIARDGSWGAEQLHRIYRGDGELFGWVGDTTKRQFIDVGRDPDFARQPPKGTNPWKVFNAAGAVIRTEYPSVVAFFEERRGFANTTYRPATLFLSAQGDYANMDRSVLPMPEQGGEWELATRKREEIRNLVPFAGKLIVLTNSCVWTFGGAGGNAISPAPGDGVDAKAHHEVGSSWLDALVVGGTVLYSRAKGTGVRDLLYDLNRESYAGGDISFIAQHFFENRTITDWCFQEDPWGVVWALLDNGKFLSLTYDRDNGCLAWAHHTTGEDIDGDYTYHRVNAMCSVPDTDKDTVWMVVTRGLGGTGGAFIERMASRVLPYEQDGFTPDVKETIAFDNCRTERDPGTFIIADLAELNGKQILALVDGSVLGPYLVAGGQIDLSIPVVGGQGVDPISDPADIEVVHVGLSYTCDAELLPLEQDGAKPKRVTEVIFELDRSRGLWVGTDEASLKQWQQRSVGDGYQALSAATEVVRMSVTGGWSQGGGALIRQTDPLFVTLYGVARNIQVGD